MRVRNLPVWALLFCIPVALSAISATVDSGAEQQVVSTDVANSADINADTMNATGNDLNLEDGATDEWRWGRWGGWGFGRWGGWGGWGRWGGWGGWGGWGYPGYSWWYPYSTYLGWYW
jgi:hypothetical protein